MALNLKSVLSILRWRMVTKSYKEDMELTKHSGTDRGTRV